MTAYWILALTVGTALARPAVGPLRVQPHAAAVLGAALMILLGVLPLSTAYQTLGFLFRPALTIVSLMAITLVAERAGLFRLVAWSVARLANGDARRLFTYLFIAGTLTGALFTNDAAVLIFTPLVYRLVEEVQTPLWGAAQKIPFYFAVLYVANLVGAFVTSNPINIVVSEWFGIGFLEYARWMMLPALISMVVSYWGLRLYFRRDLPEHCGRLPATPPIERPRFLAASGVILVLTLLGFCTEGVTGIPTVFVAAGGAALLLVVHHWFGEPVSLIARGIAWDVIAFLVGMFLVAKGLSASGLTDQVGRLILAAHEMSVATGSLVTGFTAALCSAVMNNHPVAGTMAIAIGDLPLGESGTRLTAMAALIGADLGPKLLPIGSLAALMWFRMLRERGVAIPYTQYIKVGVPVTLVAILLAVTVLNLQFAYASRSPSPPLAARSGPVPIGYSGKAALPNGVFERRPGRDAVVIPHREELQLRQIVLERVRPDRLQIEQVAFDRQQQRASANHLRRVPDPHRYLLVHRPVVVDVGIHLLGPRHKTALGDLQTH